MEDLISRCPLINHDTGKSVPVGHIRDDSGGRAARCHFDAIPQSAAGIAIAIRIYGVVIQSVREAIGTVETAEKDACRVAARVIVLDDAIAHGAEGEAVKAVRHRHVGTQRQKAAIERFDAIQIMRRGHQRDLSVVCSDHLHPRAKRLNKARALNRDMVQADPREEIRGRGTVDGDSSEATSGNTRDAVTIETNTNPAGSDLYPVQGTRRQVRIERVVPGTGYDKPTGRNRRCRQRWARGPDHNDESHQEDGQSDEPLSIRSKTGSTIHVIRYPSLSNRDPSSGFAARQGRRLSCFAVDKGRCNLSASLRRPAALALKHSVFIRF